MPIALSKPLINGDFKFLNDLLCKARHVIISENYDSPGFVVETTKETFREFESRMIEMRVRCGQKDVPQTRHLRQSTAICHFGARTRDKKHSHLLQNPLPHTMINMKTTNEIITSFGNSTK